MLIKAVQKYEDLRERQNYTLLLLAYNRKATKEQSD